MLNTFQQDGKTLVGGFSRCFGDYEWNGVTQMKAEKMQHGTGHVFQLLEPHLPIEFMNIRTREIDTEMDYEHAVNWVVNGYK